MQSLQDYILENYDINEGKVWDAVKKWFKELFTPSTKKYDRYAKDFDASTRSAYMEYLKQTFSRNNITIKKILSDSDLAKIVKPNNIQPSQIDNKGYWKFDGFKLRKIQQERLFTFVYEDKSVKDVIALLYSTSFNDVSGLEKYFEIKKLQILPELENIYSLRDCMQDYIKFLKNTMTQQSKGIYISKSTDPNLFNKLINDCEFEKCTINTRDYAKFDFDK